MARLQLPPGDLPRYENSDKAEPAAICALARPLLLFLTIVCTVVAAGAIVRQFSGPRANISGSSQISSLVIRGVSNGQSILTTKREESCVSRETSSSKLLQPRIKPIARTRPKNEATGAPLTPRERPTRPEHCPRGCTLRLRKPVHLSAALDKRAYRLAERRWPRAE